MALDPINYLGMIQQGVGGGIGEAITSGLRTGAAIQEFRAQRNQADQAAQYAADVQAAFNSGDARAFAALSAKYPQQREAFKQSWEMLNKDQQDQEFGTGVQVWNALGSGRADVAKSLLDQHITALKNAGDDTTDLENIKRSIDADPRQARNMIGLSLSAIDPDRWGKIATEQRSAESAPFELSEKAAKAQKAAVDAKFAESKAVQDLSKGGWEIQKLANDISIARENSRIAAANAKMTREIDDLKRRELRAKLDGMERERDQKISEKTAEISSARSSIDNMLNTADRILNTPIDIIESAAGPVSSKILTVSSDTADLEELVNTLGSQAFMAQIPNLKGMGALSNAEGEKLQSSLQNLSLRQSPKRLVENIQESQRLILKARQNLSDKYGVPDTIPDRPAAADKAAPQGFRVINVERR